MLLCRTIKLLSIPSANKYSKKYLKVCEADALKQVDTNVREGENKNRSSLYYSNSNSNTATRKTRIKARTQLIKRQRLESEAQLRKASKEEDPLDSDDYCLDSSSDINSKNNLKDEEATTAKDLAREQKKRLKALLNAKIRDSLSARLTGAYILYFKELSSDNSRIFASDTFTLRTRQKCEMPKQKIAIDPANSTLCDLSDLLVVRFCIFSNPALENIGIPTNKEVVEMQTNTATTLANKLAAVNKLTILEANTPAVHSKATKHRPAPSAAQFVIVCGFRKVDKHIFRAYNTISVTAQRTIIRKGSPYIEKRAILLPSHITFNATDKRDSVTSNCIYKIEDAHNIIANIKHDASKHESSYKDILEKEGLNKSEASRRVIFNCFKIQAIASYSTLATLKAAQFKTYSSCKVKRFTLNSIKDLFTNLSKNYFLVQEARAITKSSLNIAAEDTAKAANTLLPLKEVCAKILIESYKPIVQAIIVALIAFAEAITLTEATYVVIIELQDSIVYFNPDSKLELKVLGKQDVKTTS
ncbi:hypothetical protein HBI62_216860 [Parastagonospora nodorum]|nr:hypothetical protein HBI62_216860 [Parastagonospora nodorum]KAH6139599.1 hypothetical protein HBI63_212330 [Parastagonospora nodorum]KAH6167555.1 hypothetical protein HBI61_202660 [Parastagonospora nodorum]